MTPVEVRFKWTDVDLSVGAKALAGKVEPKLWQTALIIAVGCAMSFFAGLRYDGIGGIFAFVFGLNAALIWSVLRQRRANAGMMRSPARQGDVAITFEKDGYRQKTPRTETWSDWDTITAIFPAKGMLVLAIGEVEYMPILDSALPEGMDRAGMIAFLCDRTGLIV